MNDFLVIGGIIFLSLGIVLLILGFLLEGTELKVEGGIGGFIGPIPFGWATNPEILKFILLVVLVLILGFLLFK